MQLDWNLLNLKTPILDCLLLEKLLTHLLDLVDLVLWSDPRPGQSVTHAWRLSDAIRDSIDQTELWRKVVVGVRDLDSEERLADILHSLVVDLAEVVSDLCLNIIEDERVTDWVLLKVNIVDDVGPLVAPVSDDALVAELEADDLLELVLAVAVLSDLIDPLEACLSCHKLEDVIDGKGAPIFTLEGRCLEARPDFDASMW